MIPDANNLLSPGIIGNGGRGGGPPSRSSETPTLAAANNQTCSTLSDITILVNGAVVENVGNALTILDSQGIQEQDMLGPPCFWSENGILLEPDYLVEQAGFKPADHHEVKWIVNRTKVDSLQL